MALLDKTTLQKSAGLLNATAPEDHFLAYITEGERDMLVKASGKETPTASGVNAYPPLGAPGTSPGTSPSGGSRGGPPGGGDRDMTYTAPPEPYQPREHHGGGGGQLITTPSKADLGMVDAEDEYLAPDKDHYQATQKAIDTAIKEGRDEGTYQADWNDWTKEQQDTYQLEMNKLKGTEDVNYSFYKGNEGTTNLKFNEHWKDVAVTNPALKFSPTLRFLVAAGRTLKENFTTDYGTWKYGGTGTSGSGRAVDQGGWFGRIFNSDGSVNENISEGEAQQLYEEAQNDLPYASYAVANQKPIESQAAKWYANLGGSSGGFNLTTAYADAKSKVAQTLGSPSAVGQLAVNQSPFYNWLKENSLNKGIL